MTILFLFNIIFLINFIVYYIKYQISIKSKRLVKIMQLDYGVIIKI